MVYMLKTHTWQHSPILNTWSYMTWSPNINDLTPNCIHEEACALCTNLSCWSFCLKRKCLWGLWLNYLSTLICCLGFGSYFTVITCQTILIRRQKTLLIYDPAGNCGDLPILWTRWELWDIFSLEFYRMRPFGAFLGKSSFEVDTV